MEKKHLSYFKINLEVDSKGSKEAFLSALLIKFEASAEDNNISVEKATELFDGIRDLRVQVVTDKATSFEDKINIENQVTQQLAEQIKEGNK